ncbi:MAG: CBS domain-containing protein [Desulforhopalus sp.]|jgi:CBS domain-containing protein
MDTPMSKNTLSDVFVKDAMRRIIISLPQNISIDSSINTLIKHKISGILTLDDSGKPSGVVSKTDIIGAYYATLPIDSPLEYIMASPPLVCSMDDPLEAALEKMRESSVYRLYVTGNDGTIVGSLAYPDIVGLLYRSCYECNYSHFRNSNEGDVETIKRLNVKDVVALECKTVSPTDTLFTVMEEISTYRIGAILVTDDNNFPVGVISKTDLILAYKHGIEQESEASLIMTSPVQTCNADDLLETAVRKMIFTDIHRLFVRNEEDGDINGVFSLADAARCRSGSCHACISSRITIDH